MESTRNELDPYVDYLMWYQWDLRSAGFYIWKSPPRNGPPNTVRRVIFNHESRKPQQVTSSVRVLRESADSPVERTFFLFIFFFFDAKSFTKDSPRPKRRNDLSGRALFFTILLFGARDARRALNHDYHCRIKKKKKNTNQITRIKATGRQAAKAAARVCSCRTPSRAPTSGDNNSGARDECEIGFCDGRKSKSDGLGRKTVSVREPIGRDPSSDSQTGWHWHVACGREDTKTPPREKGKTWATSAWVQCICG